MWQEVPSMTGRVLIVMLVLSVGRRVVSQATDQTSDEPVSEEEDLPVRRDAGDWPKKSRGHTTAPSTSPCRCWNTTDESLATEVECQCRGLSVKSIPSDLSTNVHRITMTECGLETLSKGQLQIYRHTLRDFVLDRVNQLSTIEEGAFHGLVHLQRIYIRQASRLNSLPRDVFRLFLPNLRILLIQQTGLREFPYLGELETVSILHTVDLEGNQIASIPSNSVRLRADEMLLNHNAIQYVDSGAFNGSQIAKLSFRGNRLLTRLDPDAFVGLASMRQLDLSETSLSDLPTRGLSDLEVLRLVDTKTLKVIPSVYNFKSLQEAYLTYPYHCCAFKFPATHDPKQHARHNRFMAEMQKKYCEEGSTSVGDMDMVTSTASSTSVPNRSQLVKRWIWNSAEDGSRWGSGDSTSGRWNSFHSSTPSDSSFNDSALFAGMDPSLFGDFDLDSVVNGFGSGLDFGVGSDGTATGGSGSVGGAFGPDDDVFHQSTFTPSRHLFHAFCGNFTRVYRNVKCSPQPDAFNPCEDIMGTSWLRVAVWIVAIASVVGNLAVMLVLLSSRFRMTVSKMLMVNLAVADLLMGVYLLLIASMDLHTIGAYFNFAIDWQNGIGCQIAGFLTVFSSELSIFTLVVITSERWYTITYAIHLNRRLRLSTAAKIMTAVWICALLLATLPLVGISSFATTSICLPLENRDVADTAYLLMLLVINALAFLCICLCYAHMYHSISGSHTRSGDSLASHSDATVAKRMALLVFTDFACWAPIAFFGLTAVAGYPLISVTHSKILLVFFYPLNACTNPYLYALLTKQYRRDLFLILSRYGMCTERAARYRTVFSVGRSDKPRRNGSQSQSGAERLGHRSSGFTGVSSNDQSKGYTWPFQIFKKRNSSDGNHRISYSPKTTQKSVNDNSRPADEDACPELIQLTVVASGKSTKSEPRYTVVSQPTAAMADAAVKRNSKDEVTIGRRLSIVQEMSHSEENYSLHLMPGLPSSSGGVIDSISPGKVSICGSPHPIKHCQIRVCKEVTLNGDPAVPE